MESGNEFRSQLQRIGNAGNAGNEFSGTALYAGGRDGPEADDEPETAEMGADESFYL